MSFVTMNNSVKYSIISYSLMFFAVISMILYYYTMAIENILASFTAIILAINYLVLRRVDRIERRLYGK